MPLNGTIQKKNNSMLPYKSDSLFARKAMEVSLYWLALQCQGDNSPPRRPDIVICLNDSSEATHTKCMPSRTTALTEGNWLSEIKRDIKAIRDAQPEWKPAYDLADMVMLVLGETNLRPDRIVPSSEDGVSFYFFRSDGYAMIECLASREITALTLEEKTGKPEVWEVSPDDSEIRETALQIRSFTTQTLHEHSPASPTPA